MIIRKIGIRSLANIVASVYVVFGFLTGLLLTLVSLAGAGLDSSSDAMAKAAFGPAAILVLPIFYGIVGYLGAFIFGWVFNYAAAARGGLQLDVELQPTDGAS